MNEEHERFAWRRVSALLMLAAFSTAVGCGDSATTLGGGGGGSAAGAGGSGGSGGTGGGAGELSSVTFIVVESVFGDPTRPPLEGATVAFDAPGSQRVEQITGADGKVTFDGIDWSMGKAAATAYLDGYTLFSAVNLDEARLSGAFLIDDALPLFLTDQSPIAPELVTFSGTVTGLQDTAHSVVVNVVATTAGSEWMGPGTGTFTVSVPRGEPFTIQAVEMNEAEILSSGQGYDMPIYQWMQQSFSATEEDLTGTVLEFSVHALATQTVDISIATPERRDSPVRSGLGVGLVCPGNSTYCTGWSTHLDISADKSRFDDSLLWVEPDWAEAPVTSVRVYDGEDVISFRGAASWPQAGPIGTLPDTPGWITPADVSSTHPLHDAIEWELFDADVPEVSLRLLHSPLGEQANQLAWIIEAGPDATGLVVPAPPSPVDESVLLGGSPRGFLFAAWPDFATATFEAFSRSEVIRMTP